MAAPASAKDKLYNPIRSLDSHESGAPNTFWCRPHRSDLREQHVGQRRITHILGVSMVIQTNFTPRNLRSSGRANSKMLFRGPDQR